MLIKCPECDLQVSDRAFACPHCGYPLKEQPKPVRKSSRKRRRLPNGFGQISELKGRNLRKPFRAMVTVGKTPKGKPICKLLKPEAFFETYNDAYAALVEYNRNPYDLDDSMTMSELYEKWKEDYVNSGKKLESLRAQSYAWRYCGPLYGMMVKEVRPRHIQGCVENASAIIDGMEREASANTKNKVKSVLNLMFDYAVQHELTDKNYSRMVKLPISLQRELREKEEHHTPYTEEEMMKIWNSIGIVDYVDILLIQCYSGWRPGEIGLIKIKDVNLDDWSYTGGIKTEAGRNRTVPIHSRIRELVRERYNEAIKVNREYLFNHRDKEGRYSQITYRRYQSIVNNIKKALNLDPDHKPHDGRAHFVTMAKEAGVDEYAIKYMVGHSISDITERVYTTRSFDWLRSEIEKIK